MPNTRFEIFFTGLLLGIIIGLCLGATITERNSTNASQAATLIR